jgi:hypothetical protein
MRSLAYVFALGLPLAIHANAQQEASPQSGSWCDATYPAGEGWPARLNLPGWVCETAHQLNLHVRYTPETSINPFFLSGDFNSDRKTDAAIWVTSKNDSKRGIVILHQGSKQLTLLGAGNNYQDRGDDFTGLDVWSLIPAGVVLDSSWEDHRKVVLVGDALVVGKSESSSVAIYWDGKAYTFYELSD